MAIEDIRIANRIFLERDYLISLNNTYLKKLEVGDLKIENSLMTDSLLREEIRRYAIINTSLEEKNDRWKKVGIVSVTLNVILLILIF